MKQFIGLLLAVISIACGSETNKKTTEVPSGQKTEKEQPATVINTMEDGLFFGYTNEPGTVILLLDSDSIQQPKHIKNVLSAAGVVLHVAFTGTQKANDQDSGRQNYFNFSNSGGHRYEVEKATLPNDQTVVLCTDAFLKQHQALQFDSKTKGTLANDLRSKIERDKGRTIKRSAVIATVKEKVKIALVEFEMKGNQALVVLAAITPTKISYKDFPAEYDEMSTWGVDDGGDFGFEWFTISTIFENKGSFEMVTDWAGAEGTTVEYLKEENGKLVTVKKAYRYTAPL
ncbi:hypothetical protein [Flavobacterium kingsejongi]|uniref:Lipoprotein n=1 Tax=Flavobacterium kingsejongi TaxID=1678728 RepID=A0A2S1LJL4_9FLAO|nr:hypothetical protein [Flavobacterium kingsejongi]AWG23953.1 hypothetical protein FK004_01300 [Flavobacterium kingsejongi]